MAVINHLGVIAAPELSWEMKDLFNELTKATIVWHEVHVPSFSGKDAARYISSPDLIQSEVAEMCKAIEDVVPHELIDALIDIYWEITPVIKLLEPVLAFSEALEGTKEPNITYKLLQGTLTYYSGLLLFDFHHKLNFESFMSKSVPNAIGDLITLSHTIKDFLGYLVLSGIISFEELEECINTIINSNESKTFRSDLSAEVMDILQDELSEQYPDVEVVAVFRNTSDGERIIFKNADTGKTLKHDGYYFKADLEEVLSLESTVKLAEVIRKLSHYKRTVFVPRVAKLIGY